MEAVDVEFEPGMQQVFLHRCGLVCRARLGGGARRGARGLRTHTLGRAASRRRRGWPARASTSTRSRDSSSASSTRSFARSRRASGSTEARGRSSPANACDMPALADTLDRLAAEGPDGLLPWRRRQGDQRGRAGTWRLSDPDRPRELSRDPPAARAGAVPALGVRLQSAALGGRPPDCLRAERARPARRGGRGGKRTGDRGARRGHAGGSARARAWLSQRPQPRRPAEAPAHRGEPRRRRPTRTAAGAAVRARAGRTPFHDAHQRRRRARERGVALGLDRLRLRRDRSGNRDPHEQHAGGGGPEPGRPGRIAGQPADEHDGALDRPRRGTAAPRGRERGVDPAARRHPAVRRQRARPRPHRPGGDRGPARSSRGRGAPARGRHRARHRRRARVRGLRGRLAGAARNLYFGGASAVGLGAEGELEAAGDPRRGGAGAVVE